MKAVIYELIRELVAFTLLVSLLHSLTAGKEYEKYIRFFAGIVCVLIMIKPIGKLLSPNMDFAQVLESNLEQLDKRELEAELKIAEEAAGEAMWEEYRGSLEQEMENFLEQNGLHTNLSLELETASENYGGIKRITVTKVWEQENESFAEVGEKEGADEHITGNDIGKGAIGVEPVEVEPIEISLDKEAAEHPLEERQDVAAQETSLKRKVKQLLVQQYQIKKSKIIFA